jgi:hypothetical protein
MNGCARTRVSVCVFVCIGFQQRERAACGREINLSEYLDSNISYNLLLLFLLSYIPLLLACITNVFYGT